MSSEGRSLKPWLSRTGAWALALGTSIGWGSLVITSSTYLGQAGQLSLIRQANARGMAVVVIVFGISLAILLSNYALMSRRAAESEHQLNLVRDRASRDPLTGVKSKHAYAERETESDAAIARGEMEPFALLVCDVNGLKHVNDILGHKAGDEYIRSASELICGIFAHSPVYRTGGDEFVVFLRGKDYEKRAEYLQELHDRSVENIALGKVVMAGGLSDFRSGEDVNIHAVFVRADAAMYEEKQRLKRMGARTRE